VSTTYEDFLRSKVTVADGAGIPLDASVLHPANKPHQDDMVRWAVEQGRGGIFASFGLGKTRCQSEVAMALVKHTDQPFLVTAPLGVKHQFQQEDGPVLGMDWQYVRTNAEVFRSDSPYLITNYERVRDGDISPRSIAALGGVSLDEGSVLRSLGSKTQQLFNEVFARTPYRFVATATPAPNAFRELLNYAEFLGVMDRGQALTRWFMRNPSKAGDLQLHPQHAESFWLWVSSWALFLFTPSDLDHSDEGYALPPLKVHWHRLDVDHSRAWDQADSFGQRRLILNAAAGISESAAESRATLPARLEEAKRIMAEHPSAHWLLWHHLEAERKAIEKAIPDAVTVYGSQALEVREQRILDFAHGRSRILATKPEIAGSGCNFQRHCSRAIFLGVDPNYRFQDFIQAVHRIYRFLQTEEVHVHIIYAESQDDVVRILRRKWAQHDEMTLRMREIVREYGLSKNALLRGLRRTMGVERREVKGELFTAVHNDCVFELRRLADNSVGMVKTSIPFAEHYEYSEAIEDFGHNEDPEHFWRQMDFAIPELYRVLSPGRIAAIHVKDLIHYGHRTEHGFMEIYSLTADAIVHFLKHGFMYMGEHYITTDVVRENNSTNRLGYSEMCKDATKMGAGLGEKLLIFRKPPSDNTNARADIPVTKDKADYSLARWQLDAHGYWRSNGNRPLTSDELYDYEAHVERLEDLERKGRLPRKFLYEPPRSPSGEVWDSINPMRVLNAQQSQKKLKKHVCPEPFDIAERAIRLYSNPGDLILDPFGGLFTVPMMAIKLGRQAYGIDLDPVSFAAGVGYCQAAEEQVMTPTLLDYLSVVE
jgi:DNA modification methylase